MINKLHLAMINLYRGDSKRIQHFCKVHSYAKLIGETENIDKDTLFILEAAALTHDIGIHICEEKYGNCSGKFQEKEGPEIAKKLLSDLGFDDAVSNRVQYLIAHHHTYTDIDGIDYQILVEADFLVNMHEDGLSAEAVEAAYDKIFRTETGKKICKDMFAVKMMCVNDKSYEVIKLLGHGKGGYSYLVTDGTKEYVLKQIHHEPCDYYQFGNKIESEISDYERLRKIGIPMPEMFAVDIQNERILKEYIKGDTVFDYVLRDEVKPDFVEQMKAMCVLLYAADTNIDYFPTNFVVQEDKLFYIDYECNDYMEEWNFENWGIKYWSQTKEFLDYINRK